MVFFFAVSAKTAFTVGAIVGGTVAIIANKEKVMEITADVLQKGADYLHEELNKRKVKMAAMMDDGELGFNEKNLLLSSEATTPEASDQESETDDEMDSDTFSVDSLKMSLGSFENIREKEGLVVFERFSESNSTLIGKGKDGKNMDSDLDLD